MYLVPYPYGIMFMHIGTLWHKPLEMVGQVKGEVIYYDFVSINITPAFRS